MSLFARAIEIGKGGSVRVCRPVAGQGDEQQVERGLPARGLGVGV